MLNKIINQEFLFDVLGLIVDRIEKCGASPDLTCAVSLAADLRLAIGNKYNPSNINALSRVCNELKEEIYKEGNAISEYIGLNPKFESLDIDTQERFKIYNDKLWQEYEKLEKNISDF